MKKYLFFGMIGAMALTFNACSSDDALVDNPNYNPETNEVGVDFIFNVATNDLGTRSAATTVQFNGANFRGLNDAILLAYKNTSKNFVDATAAAADAAKRYDFPNLLAAGAVTNDNTTSNRILELGLPVETNAMLFYGHAPTPTTTDEATKADNGAIEYKTTGNKANAFEFDLVKRIDGNVERCHETAQYLCYIMTCVAHTTSSVGLANIKAAFPDATEEEITARYPGWTDHSQPLVVSWEDLGNQYLLNLDEIESNDVQLTPLEEILGKMYASFTSVNTNEYRAGSGPAILYMLSDIYAAMDAVAHAEPTSFAEYIAQQLSQMIMTRIGNFCTHDTSLTGYQTLANAQSAAYNYAVNGITNAATWSAAFGNVVATDLAKFPVTTFHLPYGAAIISWDAANKKFENNTSKRVTDSTKAINTEEYMYPAEIMYRCNSWIRTSDVEKKNADYPNGRDNWDDNSKWNTGWSAANSKVTSSTRAAALGQNINYGVALLESTLGVKADVTKYEDNTAKFYPGEDPLTVAVGDLDITLTGVLVGGQPAAANWEFLPKANEFVNVIYDNAVGGGNGIAAPKAAGQTATPNYTAVLDNFSTAATQTDEVRVALEFKNNGDSFWGRDNMVRKDGTFYLIGKLQLTNDNKLADSAWDEYYQVPPLDANGASQKVSRIFIQDYVTKAKFNLTEDALKNAYVTVPDLRSAQISFGLSVDIEWRPGIEFVVDLGGDN